MPDQDGDENENGTKTTYRLSSSEGGQPRSSFGEEVGGGIGCLLFVIALLLLFDIGGFRSAVIRHFLGG